MPGTTSNDHPTPKPATARPPPASRSRTVIYGIIVLQLVAVVMFLGVLVLGEGSRFSLIALYLPRAPLLVATVGCGFLAVLARRHVRFLVPLQIVLSLVVLFPVMGLSVAGTQKEQSRRIRLATYNIHYGHDGKEEILAELEAFPVDLIVLQAAFHSLTDELTPRLPDRHIRQDDEWCLISKFPIRSMDPAPPLGDDTAMFVKFVVDTPRGPLRLYDVHPYSPRHALFADDDTRANIDNRENQIAIAARAARSETSPFLLVGDTNLPPMSGIARRHLGGFRDAFEEAGFGFGYTFTAKRPFMRIDRCFGGGGVRFLEARVGERGVSDHRPLLVDFEMPSSPL